jgi:hypothetical protein
MFLIGIIGYHGQGIQGIHTHTALKAGARIGTQGSAHLGFIHQVIETLVDVAKPVYLFAGQMRGGSEQGLIVRFVGQLVGGSNAVYRRPDNGVIHRAFHTLAKQVNLMVHIAYAIDILLGGFHENSPLIAYPVSIALLS